MSNLIGKIWNRSIRRQLLLGIALVHAVLMTIFVYDLVSRQRTFLHEQSISNTLSLSQTLASNAVSWILANDVIGLEEVVNSQSQFPDLLYAMILSPDGRVLGHSDRSKVGLYIEDPISCSLIDATPSSQFLINDKTLVDISSPIFANEQLIGWARVAISQKKINEGLQVITRDGIYYTLFAIVVGSIFALIMARGLTSGIQHLVRVSGKIAKGHEEERITFTRYDEIGQLGHTLNKMLDTIISQKKQTEVAQQALQKSSTHLRTLIETLPDLVWLKDPDGVYLACNPKFERFFGAKEAEIVGKTDYDFVGRELADFFREKDKAAMAVGGPSVNEEEITFADDGHRELLETIKTPMYDSNGSLVGVIGIARDITARREMEVRLKQTYKMEAIGTMAGGIAHDFNNILATVIGYAELAQDDIPASSPAKAHIEEILIAGLRAKELTHQILTYSRMSRFLQDHVLIDIVSLVKEEIIFQRSVIPTTVEITTDIDENCGQIIGDSMAIHQLMMNICSNASHAMQEEEGVLKIALHTVELTQEDLKDEPVQHPPGRYIKLSISDTGTGIPQELIGRIFDPYFTTREIGKGSGMGLVVVHGIVKDHDAFIHVESQTGRGSVFDVFFPEAGLENVPEQILQ